MDLPRWTGQFKARDGDTIGAMAGVVLPMTPQNPLQPVMMADRSQESLALVRQLVADPTYNLK